MSRIYFTPGMTFSQVIHLSFVPAEQRIEYFSGEFAKMSDAERLKATLRIISHFDNEELIELRPLFEGEYKPVLDAVMEEAFKDAGKAIVPSPVWNDTASPNVKTVLTTKNLHANLLTSLMIIEDWQALSAEDLTQQLALVLKVRFEFPTR